MDNLLVIILALLLGMGLARTDRVPPNASAALNAAVIHVCLPAVTFLAARKFPLTAEILFAPAMGVLVFLMGFAVFGLALKKGLVSKGDFGALMLTSALGNTSFVGLPMIEAHYGREFLPLGVLADQGTFVCMALPGLALATTLSAGRADFRLIGSKILRFTPLQTLFLGLILRPLPLPDILLAAVQRFADALTPMALLAVGLALDFGRLRRAMAGRLALGIGFKLFLAPALLYLLYVVLLGGSGDAVRITLFEAAMPPMVIGAVLSREYGLSPDLAGMLLGLGIPLSLATLPLWKVFLAGV